MTENQNNPTVPNNQTSNQSNSGQNNQNKENNSQDKTNVKVPVKEDEKAKTAVSEENQEQIARKHPHETSTPVSTPNKDKGSL